jgi:hypothetical protein
MRVVLKIMSVMVGLAVALTALSIFQLGFSGLVLFAHAGAIGIATLVGWFLIVTAGPAATIQLWRLRRVGLFLAALLCTLALAYYLVGLLFLGAPAKSIIGVAVANGAFLAILLSSAARRACVDSH